MANDLFKIFGLDSTCTEEELDNKYNELKAKYREDMFLEGRDGDIAAKKLTELENAYYDIKTEMSYKAESEKEDKESYTSDDFIYEKIEKLVKEGALNEAQVFLDDIMALKRKSILLIMVFLIGWHLLSVLTCGILEVLYVSPD